MKCLTITMLLLVLPGALAEEWVVPHFTFAGDQWETRLSLVNPHAASHDVVIQAFDHEGQDLGETRITLDPGAGVDKSVSELIQGLNGKKGWLKLVSDAPELGGLMRFGHSTDGGVTSLPLIRETGKRLLLPLLENSGDRATGLVVANLTSTAVDLTITYTSLDGLFRKEHTTRINARAKLVAMAADLFGPDLPEKANIHVQASGSISGFALTFVNGARQIIAVPGSILADQELQEQALETFIRDQMDQAGIPGLSAALVVNGDLVWSGGFGNANLATGRAVTAQTPFLLASISKAITGTAVTQVMEKGDFDLETPVNDLLPFVVDNPWVNGDKITVGHLLTHTSAIADNWNMLAPLYVDGDSPLPLGSFLEDYLTPGGAYYHTDNFWNFPPGADFEYSNEGAALAGYLVEAATGVPLDNHCDNELFAPLGMTNTGWHLADFNPEDVAVPYLLENQRHQVVNHYGFPDWPNGQCRSSAVDMARFLAAVMGDGGLGKARILSEASLADMLTPKRNITVGTGLTGVGNLWFHFRQDQRSLIGHDGGEAGAGTFLAFDPQTSTGFVVLTNVSGVNYDETPVFAIQSRLLSYADDLRDP